MSIYVSGTGNVEMKTIHIFERPYRHVKFKLEYKPKSKITLVIKDKILIDWFMANIETNMFRGKMLSFHGELFFQKFKTLNGTTLTMNSVRVRFLQFLDFADGGKDAINGGLFECRNMQDYKNYFNVNDSFISEEDVEKYKESTNYMRKKYD